MAFQATAPLVVVRTSDDGPFVHVYEGSFLPEDADPDHVAQLVEQGMVAEAAAPSDEESDESPNKRGRKAR